MTHVANEEQQDYWSGDNGKSWIADEMVMDGLFVEVVDLLLHRAGAAEGRDILDIGCGTGALSLAFAEAGARVVASDISQPLLARAKERSGGRFETFWGDAQVAVWPRLFDLVVSRFGVMFFEDPVAAFANISKALKPDGRLLLAAWGAFEENVWWSRQRDIAREMLGIESVSPDPYVPGPMGLSDADWGVEKMQRAGLVDTECHPIEVFLRFPGTSELVGQQALKIGFGARLLRMHDAMGTLGGAYAARVTDAFREFETEGQTRVPAMINLYMGRAA
ncbi:MAG: class I SAM-dependent methyltransferase [Pseudomonadota bacterium]